MLASEIAKNTQDILCLPELKMVEILQLLGSSYLYKANSKQILAHLKTDPRWKNIYIEDNDFIEKVNVVEEKTVKSITDAVVHLIMSKNKITSSFCLIKNGTSLWNATDLISHFPNAQFLHIYRDPRGVISSMKLARSAFVKNQPFTRKTTYQLSLLYNRYRENVRLINTNVYSINYKELILNHSTCLDNLFSHYQLNKKKAEPIFSISKKEKTLHKNIGLSPNIKSIDRWKTNLIKEDIALIEHLCSLYLIDPKLYENIPLSFYIKKQKWTAKKNTVLRYSHALWFYLRPNNWKKAILRIKYLLHFGK